MPKANNRDYTRTLVGAGVDPSGAGFPIGDAANPVVPVGDFSRASFPTSAHYAAANFAGAPGAGVRNALQIVARVPMIVWWAGGSVAAQWKVDDGISPSPAVTVGGQVAPAAFALNTNGAPRNSLDFGTVAAAVNTLLTLGAIANLTWEAMFDRGRPVYVPVGRRILIHTDAANVASALFVSWEEQL